MKKPSFLHPSKIYVRYYAFYLLVFCVPVLVTSIFFISVSRRDFRNALLSNSQSTVEKIESRISSELNRINAIARELSECTDLNPAFLWERPDNWTTVTNRLYTISITSDLVSRIVYYPFPNPHDLLFSSNTTYTLKTFFATHSPYETWDMQSFVETAKTLKAPAIRTGDILRYTYQEENVLTYLYPMPLYSEPYGVLLLQVRQKDLEAMMSLGQWSTALWTEDGTLIAGGLPFDQMSFPGEEQWLRTMKTPEGEYLVCGQRSLSAGFLLVAAVPSAQALSNLTSLDTLWIVLLIGLMGVGLFLVSFIARRTYAPIRSLRDVAPPESLGGNEIDVAISTIKTLRINNQTLSSRLKQSMEEKQNALLASLLRGEFDSLEQFGQQAGPVQLALSGDTYRVAILGLKPPYLPNEFLLEALRGLPGAAVAIHPLQSPLRSEWIWLITYEEREEPALYPALQAYMANLAAAHHAAITISVGDPVKEVSQIFVSYLQAQAAKELEWMTGGNQIILFSEFSMLPSINLASYPKQDLEVLYDAVLRLDLPGAMAVIDRLSHFLGDRRISLFQARCLCYEMINTTLRAMRHVDINFTLEDVLPDIAVSQRLKNAADVADVIRLLIQSLQQKLPQYASGDSEKTIQAVQAFIREHLEDPDLNIQSICEAFSISASNLSHKFRACASITVSEYILALRMDRAKELLAATNLSIADIALRMGYSDTSGFGKKFKAVVGLSPGEYRKKTLQ